MPFFGRNLQCNLSRAFINPENEDIASPNEKLFSGKTKKFNRKLIYLKSPTNRGKRKN